jgi:hypothetical protein
MPALGLWLAIIQFRVCVCVCVDLEGFLLTPAITAGELTHRLLPTANSLLEVCRPTLLTALPA